MGEVEPSFYLPKAAAHQGPARVFPKSSPRQGRKNWLYQEQLGLT